jgi:hypothetical protein
MASQSSSQALGTCGAFALMMNRVAGEEEMEEISLKNNQASPRPLLACSWTRDSSLQKSMVMGV